MPIKSQSAMEYLMTYGWAVLAIAIVIIALFQLGVFGGNNLTPHSTSGACQAVHTAAGSSLAGQCNTGLPKFVAQFNGQNSYISFGNAATLSPEAGSNGQMTICLWYDVLSLTNYHGFLLKGESAPSSGNAWEYAIGQGNSQMYVVWNSGGSNIAGYGATLPSVGQWYLSCFTYNYPASNAYYYLDGVQNTVGWSSTSGTASQGTGALVVGAGENGYSNVELADVQVYNISLSSNEVSALYQEGIGGAPIDPAHIVGWWPLNGNAQDYSGDNNNGQAINVAYNSTWSLGYVQP